MDFMRMAAQAAPPAAPAAPAVPLTELVTGPVTTTTTRLNDGRAIPTVGLGVYQTQPGATTYGAVLEALRCGYRHIDTAMIYQNEADVGRAIRDSGIPREQLWITSKHWSQPHPSPNGFEAVCRNGEASSTKLGTYIDMYLVHSPHHPAERLNVWRGMEELQRRGVVKSIGVSNYGVRHLRELAQAKAAGQVTVTPAVNQVEVHPFLRRDDIEAECLAQGIVLQAYSPLAKAQQLTHGALKELGARHSVSAAQVMLRWSLQRGYVLLPKSKTPARIAENAQIFGFQLSADDMKLLNSVDMHLVTGWDPTTLP